MEVLIYFMSIDNINISMTGYRWTRLLDRLYEDTAICNRNQEETIELYEEIATQLNGGKPVKLIHPQNPDPAYRPQREVKKTEETKEPKEGKLKKFFSANAWRRWA
jgi:hypothetical protein